MNMKVRYPHFHLIDWPFRVVPDERFYSLMADRTQLVSDEKTLLYNLSRRSASSMHLMWAWFGAGKTHTLHHIEYLCANEFEDLITIYTEFPRAVKNFVDLYRAFISKVGMDIVDDVYSKIYGDKIQKELYFDFPDLSNALTLNIGGTDEQQDIVIRWLRAECRNLRTLRTVSISKPIQTAEDCIKAISWIIRLMSLSNPNNQVRTIWMIDEFQRIEKCRVPAREEVSSSLHSIFNRCPNSLSIIISFSGFPEEKKLPSWLSPEIKDRIGIEKPLLLPPLSSEESYKFVQDVLTYFRNPETISPNPLFPFNEDSVRKVISLIEEKAKRSKRKDQPKPRTIMQFFNRVLEEADPKIETGELKVIDTKFASEVLKDVTLPREEFE